MKTQLVSRLAPRRDTLTSIDYVPDAVNRIHDLKINAPNQEIPVGGASRNWFTREVYGYDAMNRLTSIQRDEEPNMSDQFRYSLDGQLTSADYGLHWANNQWGNPIRTVDYTLDKAGNRNGTAGVTADGTPFNYEPNGLNQYITAHSGMVGNGANHEITSYDGKNYAYVNDTRLAQVSYTDVSGTHLYQLGYDALGRCVRRTTGGSSTTYYIYDGERSIYEFDSGGGTPSTNVYGRGIDEIIARSNHGTGQYPMQDRLGSVILVTGGDGTILESYRYDAFGAPTMKKPDGTVIATGASLINNRFLFTGREYASQFGIYEYRARAYHPGIGRFMSEDPTLFDANDYNLFRYCKNDPMDLTDPMGLYGRPADEWTDKEWARYQKAQNKAIEIDKAAKAAIDHAIADGKDNASKAVAKVFKDELGNADRKTMQRVSNELGKRLAALEDDGMHGFWAHPTTDQQTRAKRFDPKKVPAYAKRGGKDIYLNVGRRWSDKVLAWATDHEAGHNVGNFHDFAYVHEERPPAWRYHAMSVPNKLMNADTHTAIANMLGEP